MISMSIVLQINNYTIKGIDIFIYFNLIFTDEQTQ